jgi:hypothetical protein
MLVSTGGKYPQLYTATLFLQTALKSISMTNVAAVEVPFDLSRILREPLERLHTSIMRVVSTAQAIVGPDPASLLLLLAHIYPRTILYSSLDGTKMVPS